ncbi:MAG: circadian clock protein KaiC [Desulfarculaceae bacterium]|nr:circadian clock protein KaiC [Desulfarculaceae bacterium]MCF8048476.1 circadian clock protein KaiC [Desulfarculaceae bacterium]MCF8064418.1 circadian clock protein KaiC [Desulfarculaceae bacterium]MCF8098293.1 circadian clock protein KaiC [Desulfarculaceae bacterium]MCF8124123.1 circadian clock protein KaiC [Desulfarculaceae bacterium]
MKKLPTGIAGLDVVLHGGLPRGRTTALVGGPGGGKTSFCTNIAANCAGRGDTCLFLSFEMSHKATTRDAASLGFDLRQLEEQGGLVFVDGRPVLGQQKIGEFDLGGLLALVKGLSQERKVKLVILDALEVLLQLFRDPDQQVQALQELHIWLEENNFTSLITARASERLYGQTDLGQIEFMCDCLIYVDQRVEQELTTRRLRVVKYRGSDSGRNEYPFIIAPGGIKLMALSDSKLDKGPLLETVSSGHPELDKLLGGGYRRGSSVLLTGETGTGKTTFASIFADAACRAGEKLLYVGFEEASQAIVAEMRSTGLDLEPMIKKGNLRFHTVMPESLGVEEHLIHIVDQVETFQPKHVIVDAISAFLRLGGPMAGFNFAARLITYLKSHGITILLLNQIDGMANAHEISGMGVSTLLDAVVFLRYVESDGELNRVLLTLKSRGMAHSNQYREYFISDNGVEFLELYTGTGGVKTGAARQEQEARGAAELQRRKAEVKRLELAVASKRATVQSQRDLEQSDLALAEAELDAARLELDLWHQGRQRRGEMRQGHRADSPKAKKPSRKGKKGGA